MLSPPIPHEYVNDYSKRTHKDVARTSPTAPLSISTNLTSIRHPDSPQTLSARLRSPYISSRQPLTIAPSPIFSSPSAHSHGSSFSSILEDVLAPGDIVGEGVSLQGEPITLVSPPASTPTSPQPAREFEVVRRLGAGSYAVVYLVREILHRPPPSEDGHSVVGHMDIDGKQPSSTVYGSEYAIKCLSKANLNSEALTAQMDEVTIHQSLHSHPNIVTLHRTLETSSFLLLLLEYVPGEDLFYFLEQARDHHDSVNTPEADAPASRTPPTPSLLSTMNSAQLLSRTRLRLISSMFSQMCEAVAACHAQQVFHRDIKPENFIVTDGVADVDGRRERRVVVKLTDFGLSTTDLESSDMDCGSAPYMSYECRNNLAPSYRPRAADVWSLGIVLINMLYHYNPWTDTKDGACSSFDIYRQQPVTFFMQRFVGMTRPVAEYLANNVFNILDDPTDDKDRVSAANFGVWAKDLPDLLAQRSGHHRASSTASLSHGHRISCSIPLSHRPSSRQASGTASTVRGTPAIPARSLSRAGSFGGAFEQKASELSTVFDQSLEEQEEEDIRSLEAEPEPVQEVELPVDADASNPESRSPSTNKRRKRGARKGKGSQAPPTPKDETLETLASASQALAREISRASKASSLHSGSSTKSRREPVSMYAVPISILGGPPPVPPLPKITVPATAPSAPTAPSVTKKPSKWKLSFGKSSAAALGRISPVEEAPVSPIEPQPSPAPMSATATNVTNLIMGLNAHPTAPPAPVDDWARGRRARLSPSPSTDTFDMSRRGGPYNSRSPGVSPNSARSNHRPVASSNSSMVSGNWRSSTSSAGTSTSAFTKYSNGSVRSVSTTATSVSGISSNSWRAPSKPAVAEPTYPPLPKNIKLMNGVPWELGELPRGQYTNNPVGDIFGSPPVRQPRTRKPKDLQLGTIAERPSAAPKSPAAAASSSDLSSSPRDEEGDGPKKVPKAQITALAKMLSALRR